jgi:hypothetical protein
VGVLINGIITMSNIIENKNLNCKKSELDIICWTAMGIHSKIPLCCIIFWITKWIDKITEKQRSKYFDRITSIEKRKSIKIHYIPCPICIKKENFVKIHFCKPNSPKCKIFKYENFMNLFGNTKKTKCQLK